MIRMIGVDHETAMVNIRSVFAVRKSRMEEMMRQLKNRLSANGIVLISTCNRMELWVSSGQEECSLLTALCEIMQIREEDYRAYFTLREEEEAVRHLFYLACGLRSAILAEDQILTQVKEAIDFARMNYLSDSVLEVLFRMAVSAGKKVKTQVRFTRANATAMEQAIRMLEEAGVSLKGKPCMVIGNGAYGKLAAQALLECGADVTVTVRQYHRGIVEIPKGCRQIFYGDKMQLFPECVVVVSATTSPNYTLYYDKVEPCQVDHPMYLFDLAVPRDIDPKIASLPQVSLYDLDDFRSEEIPENQEAYQQADRILEKEMNEFRMWLNYRDVIPRIQEIRQEAVEDMNLRLGKIIRKLPMDQPEKEQLVGEFDTAAGKVIANLFYALRDSLDEETFRRCIDAVEGYYAKDE